jgi:hypothetical protein
MGSDRKGQIEGISTQRRGLNAPSERLISRFS